MWARHDRLDDPPLTWEALIARRRGLRLHRARVRPVRHVLRACRIARRCALRLRPAAHARHHARGRGCRRAVPHRSAAARPRCRHGTTTTSTPRSVPASSTWRRPGPAASRLSADRGPLLTCRPIRTSPGRPVSARTRGVTGGRCRAPAETCPRRSTRSGGCLRSTRMRSTRRAAPRAPMSMRSLRSRRSMRSTLPASTSSAPRSPTG